MNRLPWAGGERDDEGWLGDLDRWITDPRSESEWYPEDEEEEEPGGVPLPEIDLDTVPW